MAERAGFEPARGRTPDGLANRCFQPLGQRSIGFRFQFNYNLRHPYGWQRKSKATKFSVCQISIYATRMGGNDGSSVRSSIAHFQFNFNFRHLWGGNDAPETLHGLNVLNFNLLHPHGWQLIGIAKLKTPFQFIFNLSRMAPLTGLEPVTFALTGRRSTIELQWSMVML